MGELQICPPAARVLTVCIYKSAHSENPGSSEVQLPKIHDWRFKRLNNVGTLRFLLNFNQVEISLPEFFAQFYRNLKN